MRWPKKVTVGSTEFKISYVNKVDAEDSHAEFVGSDRKIRIKRHLKAEDKNRALMHETLHAALYVSGVSEMLKDSQEEAVVVAIENALAPLYDRRSWDE